MAFNIDSAGVYNGSYFGFEHTYDESTLSLLSVGWDATVSYCEGTSQAPDAIVRASMQVEIHDCDFPGEWERGIFTIKGDDQKVSEINTEARAAAKRVISHIEEGGSELDEAILKDVTFVNECSKWINNYVYEQSKTALDDGKIVGLVGGDHSSPLGLIEALSERYTNIGILHIDAHMDLRDGYEGFTYSHASIMRRAMENKNVSQLTQVGVRDFSEQEALFSEKSHDITSFTDRALSDSLYEGKTWSDLCYDIVKTLPQDVYISFDIDGLDQTFCPTTGTPVPGGLTYNQALYLIISVARSGRRVIGFDLCEVAPHETNEWDANVGARLLYKLCNLTLSTNK